MPSGKNACANAFRDINGHRVLHAREAAKPTLGQNDQVGGILDLHRQTRSSFNCLRNVERSPAKVGGKSQATGETIYPAWNADAHALDRFSRLGVADAFDGRQ